MNGLKLGYKKGIKHIKLMTCIGLILLVVNWIRIMIFVPYEIQGMRVMMKGKEWQ